MISVNDVSVKPTVLAMRQVLGSFDHFRQQIVDVNNSRGRTWKWEEGVILFPQALCPSCNGAMQSNRIWQVNERGQRVVQVASLAGGLLARVTHHIHPHVDSAGYVCLGDARSATEALFLGLGMGSPYWAAERSWYKEAFDHVCSSESKRNSRNHLTGSMALTEKGLAAPPPAPAMPSPAAIETAAARRASSEDASARLVAARTVEEESPLFNGQMVGNNQSTGISADDQPSGLRLDRL